jgi:hypothetical protein
MLKILHRRDAEFAEIGVFLIKNSNSLTRRPQRLCGEFSSHS